MEEIFLFNLREIIRKSKTYFEVIKQIGLNRDSRHSYIFLQDWILMYNIDDKHLIRKCPYTENELRKLISNSRSLTEICTKIGKPESYSSFIFFDVRKSTTPPKPNRVFIFDKYSTAMDGACCGNA